MANNKYCGTVDDFRPVSEDQSRVVIMYELNVKEDSGLAEWYQVTFYKKKGIPTLEQAKQAVFEDINRQTDEKILTGFVWNDINVWLSEENQRNFSEAQRIAMFSPESIMPVTFKLGEDNEGKPVYHEFETAGELTDFYLHAVAFINQCLTEGWKRKDSIDWTPYEQQLSALLGE